MFNFQNWLLTAVVCALFVSQASPLVAEEQVDQQVSPAETLKLMQGEWIMKHAYLPSSFINDRKLPQEVEFAQNGSAIEIRGNQIYLQGKLAATFAHDLNLPAQKKEIGFSRWDLLMLTLPSGQGLLCSYMVNDHVMEIAYSHQCSCHRGTGHVLYFERAK
ncbi:hypothetical protein LOC68_27605 [Blastopirellula sp. JC732]|uniref:TIGR03067 domain-containing protein n=1 Tax=Blastopirellula sediminis TaxID=2894196 RepID=A0A9X1MV43_9BACT|nr:hypothetical protein [Blastopirellula sediminis]MCC9604522.1 hypothetical protein [Blastopirellula sediminis]MCC9632179.1 hypothetical protein [Blastopirellula sediminis]